MYFSSAPGVRVLDSAVAAAKDADVLADVADFQQAGLDAVVEVCREVSDLVGEVDQLRLERRKLAEEVFRQLWMRVGAVVTRVLHDALARGQCQVQSAMARISLLEALDDPQRMKVVIEAEAVALQAGIKCALPGVAKRRVPDIMHQRQRLRKIDV